MKTTDPEMGSAAESLYSFDGLNETVSKLANPTDESNIFGPPSIIKGETLDDPRQIAETAYQNGYADAMRMNRAGRIIERDPFLDLLRKRVEQIRKEKIQSGEIKPANKEEMGWAR